MIVGGQTEARAQLSSTIIDYHEPFDQSFTLNGPFSKMAAENSNISQNSLKLKTHTSTRKKHLYFMTWDMHTPSHTNVSKFFNFQLTFSQKILHLKC